MVSGELFNITTQGPIGPLVLAFKFSYDDWQPQLIDFVLSIKYQATDYEVKATANLNDSSVNLSMLLVGPASICLVGCAGKSLVKPLIECFDKDIQAYLTCLKSKGLSIAGEVAACAIECLVT